MLTVTHIYERGKEEGKIQLLGIGKRVVDNIQQWAEELFGQVGLGDQRRTERVVWMAARPMGSLPQQMGDWRGLKAAYRLLDNAAVSHEALSRPHWEQTRQQASMEGQTVLMVSDITEVNIKVCKVIDSTKQDNSLT